MPHGIPTRYAGRWYRSRLEARWAAFFALVGLSVEYEPCDLAGWIPDFALQNRRGECLFAEVKPVWNGKLALPDVEKCWRALTSKSPRLLGLGVNIDLGFVEPDRENGARIGTAFEVFYEGERGAFPVFAASIAEDVCFGDDPVTLFLDADGWYEPLTPWEDEDRYLGSRVVAEPMLQAWREAGNEVQWKPRRSS